MAKFNIIEINTIGSMFRFYAKFTIKGPKNTPKTLNNCIKAAAVDWISTVNAYVCIHDKRINAALENTRETPKTIDSNTKLCLT